MPSFQSTLQAECAAKGVEIRHVYNSFSSCLVVNQFGPDTWFISCWPADEMEFPRAKKG